MNRGAQILIVDDEKHIADGIRENLEAEGYVTTVAYDGEQGLAAVRRGHFDLIVLDVMMPKLDGLGLCEQMRHDGIQTPVLFLTVKGAAEDRIRGLEVGGDDYLTKPFHLKELLLRLAAILKRGAWYEHGRTTLEFGANRIDFKTYQAAAWDGAEHSLTHKEALILKVLSEHEGLIVTREDILERVWGHEVFPSTRTVDNFIVRLRKRFERNPEAPAHFHTIRGVGYRFTQVAIAADPAAETRRVSAGFRAHDSDHADAQHRRQRDRNDRGARARSGRTERQQSRDGDCIALRYRALVAARTLQARAAGACRPTHLARRHSDHQSATLSHAGAQPRRRHRALVRADSEQRRAQ
jgi:two-component system alkaline phosphatase synthesis response regulator PhoP